MGYDLRIIFNGKSPHVIGMPVNCVKEYLAKSPRGQLYFVARRVLREPDRSYSPERLLLFIGDGKIMLPANIENAYRYPDSPSIGSSVVYFSIDTLAEGALKTYHGRLHFPSLRALNLGYTPENLHPTVTYQTRAPITLERII